MKLILAMISAFSFSHASAQDTPLGGLKKISLKCVSVGEPVLGATYTVEHDFKPVSPESNSFGLRVLVTPVVPNAEAKVHELELHRQDSVVANYESEKYVATLNKHNGQVFLSLVLKPGIYEPFMSCSK